MPLSQARKGLEVAIGTMEGWMVVAGAVNGLGRVATGQSQWQWPSRGRGGKVKIWLGMAKCPDPPGPRLPLTLIRWVWGWLNRAESDLKKLLKTRLGSGWGRVTRILPYPQI
ncbi:hypothetical protein CsSME_00000559 [Camellia sinensis var. sinensis]